jgi:hypothetical protein
MKIAFTWYSIGCTECSVSQSVVHIAAQVQLVRKQHWGLSTAGRSVTNTVK